MLTAILTFIPPAVLIVLLPGPDTLVVLRALVRQGRVTAARTVLGVLTGLSVWVTAASLGLAAVLKASETAYTVLRLTGAAYLLFIGVQSLRSRTVELPLDDTPATRRRSLLGSGYVAGLATDLLNPKVGVFFVTFLPGFIPAHQSVAVVSFILGAIFIALTAAYFVVMLGLATRVTSWMANARIRKRLDRATGGVLIAFGVRLATES